MGRLGASPHFFLLANLRQRDGLVGKQDGDAVENRVQKGFVLSDQSAADGLIDKPPSPVHHASRSDARLTRATVRSSARPNGLWSVGQTRIDSNSLSIMARPNHDRSTC